MDTSQLLNKLASGSASQAEYQYFIEWFESLSEQEQGQVLEKYESLLPHNNHIIPQELSEKIGHRIKEHEQKKKWNKLIQITRWSAAAAVLAAITWLVWPSVKEAKTTQAPLVVNPGKQDIAPASQGAILTLADGAIINLDTISNGNITAQGNLQLIKKDSQLIYTVNSSDHSENNSSDSYNMMQAPRGRQFQLILPDGSKVWLNAASSIRYPTVFKKSERNVTITGEVYFEIAKETNRPFKVRFNTTRAGGGEVEVLGTHFDINAYEDEPVISTTLLEGKVKLSPVDAISPHPIPGYTLAPGTKGILTKPSGKLPQIIVEPANTEETMAWKNGRFLFNETSIENIMRQVARWYDVDISYPKGIPDKKFTADLSRQTKLSEFLDVMELSGFNFTINEKKLTVTLK